MCISLEEAVDSYGGFDNICEVEVNDAETKEEEALDELCISLEKGVDSYGGFDNRCDDNDIDESSAESISESCSCNDYNISTIDLDDDDDDLVVYLKDEIERLKLQYKNENAELRAEVISLNNIIQAIKDDASSSSGREPGLKAVRDIAQEYYDNNVDEGRLSSEHQIKLRDLIQKEHSKRKPRHRYSTKLMTDDQFRHYVFRLTDRFRKSRQKVKKDNDAAKQIITDEILLELEKDAPFIAPGSDEAAYIIQCIMVSYLLLHYIHSVCYS